MYSLVLLMMCRVRGLIPAGSFSSAWIRGISSPVSRFLIITLARISCFQIVHKYTFSEWTTGGRNVYNVGSRRKIEYSPQKQTEELLLHLSVLAQSWNVDAEGLEFVLHCEMGPVHPHFPEKKNKKQTLCDRCYAIQRFISEKFWMSTKRKFRFTASLTCAVTTLSPLVALARSSECCSSLVRLLTVLLGDIRPEGSRASPLTKPTGKKKKKENHTTYNFI